MRDECGEVGEFRLAGQRVVMLSGEEAQEAFFRAPDEQLDQAAAYPFMTPIFGKGVVFDATPEQRKQALRNQALRDKIMRSHAEVIAAETERAIASWGEAGEIDLLDFFAELTIYTSSACLIGKEFREELTGELVARLPRAREGHRRDRLREPVPAAARRSGAATPRAGAWSRSSRRSSSGARPRGARRRTSSRCCAGIKNPDGSARYTADMITGMFVSMMFAGHHTTSTAASWTLIELLRHPGLMKRVVDELDGSTPTAAR